MNIKKKLLAVLLAAFVVLTMAAGVRWNLEHYVLVDFHFYPRNEAMLDLREENIPASRYEKLAKKLPDCDILWKVPLSGGGADSDSREITLTELSAEDVALAAWLPQLRRVNAEGCADYENLLALEQAYPHLNVIYSVALGTDRYDRNAENITVSGVTEAELSRLDNMRKLEGLLCAGGEAGAAVSLREACEARGIGFGVLAGGEILGTDTESATLEAVTGEELMLLASLPELGSLHLIRPEASAQELIAMAENNPHMDITWEVEVCGVLCASTDRELDLSGGEVTAFSDFEAMLDYFPDLEKVFLGKTNLDNETLAAYREENRERFKLVWTVELGSKLTARTDDTSFMPVRENVYYFNDEEAYNLRYCEDMVCIDIGHMSIHNIDFVEFMPNLEYLVLAHTQLQYIDPISTCKKLKFLELDWSPLRDLSPLTGCTALEDLNLGNTYASFEPVMEMTWLKNLWVIGCSSGTAYKMSQALPDTNVQGSGSATVDSGWRDLPNYYAMRDKLGMHYMSW